MLNRTGLRSTLVFTCLAALGVGSGSALAEGHGGGHFGGGGYGGHAYGGYRGGYAGHAYGGYRGGYGWHGGYGWRGYGGYYGGWGWGGVGLGLGLYFATLPLFFSTLWWDGIPYYYANDTYYRYDTGVGQYVTVAPPPQAQNQASAQEPVGTDLIAYPKNGQTADQQSKDKYECHHWAATQTGFDPTQGAAAGSADKRTDYMRAQAACMEGRGYSVK
ncbi:MAG: hypothetical protein JWN43_994 [Gammaproteobacteria bacterium]|nr:hypothetical protein [Gammaproteobacteria bacterium]